MNSALWQEYEALAHRQYLPDAEQAPLWRQLKELRAQERASAPEEAAAFRKTALKLRNRLVEANLLPLIRICRKHFRLRQDRDEIAELVADGSTGMLVLTETYDPKYGVPFGVYAVRVIRGSAEWGRRKMAPGLRQNKCGGPRVPGAQVESIDQISSDDVSSDCTQAAGEMATESSAEHTVYMNQVTERITKGMAGLREREKAVIRQRWLADAADRATLLDLAKEFGCSREYVRQVEEKAMKKLREAIADCA